MTLINVGYAGTAYDDPKYYFMEKEVHWYRNDGSKPTPRRKALNRADEFDNRGQNDRANKIRNIVISKDHGDTYDARRKARDIKVDDNKVGKLPTAAKSDKRGAIDVKHNLKKLKEVAPPAWGHTKAEKEKTKPDKPKSKIGGTAAAFKRALDDGRFKGLPGDKTKKEKTASMFKLMWAMKKKGAKPHYKPGTDEKYKKYQEEFVAEREDSPYEKASSGALSGKTRSSGASKTEPKTGFGRKAHRNSAAMIIRAKRKAERSGKKLSDDSAADLAHKGWASSVKHHKSSMTPEQQKRRQKLADTPYKKLSKDEQEKDKVSAKAIMSVHDKQKYQKVDEALVSRRTKDWPKGSIDPSSTKERLAGDLIDLEKQDKRAGWTAAQLRAKKKKYQTEAVKGQDTDSRKEGAKERATEKKAEVDFRRRGPSGGKKRPLYSTTRHTKSDAEAYATQQKQSIKWHDKRTKGKFIPGTTTEETSMPNVKEKDRGAINKRFKGLFKKDVKGTVQGVNESTTMQDNNLFGNAYAYDKLKKKIGSKKKHDKPVTVETFDINPKAHKTAQKQAKIRNLAKDNKNPNEKAAAEKRLGPKLIGEKISYQDFLTRVKR